MSEEAYENLDVTLDPAVIAVIEKPTEEQAEGTAETTETETQEAGETVEQKAEAEEHKKKTGSSRLRDKLTRSEAENQALRDALARGKQPDAPVQTDPNAKPNPDDPKWTSHAEYEEARIAYEVNRRLDEHEQKAKMRVQQDSWAAKEEPVAAKYDDYPEVFQDFIAAKPSQFLTQAILKAPEGPEIAYYLGNNPQELRRLNAMDPVDQVLAVGDIRAKFKQPTTERTVKTTQAPAPIAPLTGASKPVQRDASADRYEQY
jgi:hypothetical protein